MKIPNSKKNDRQAFFNLPPEQYATLSKARRNVWRKPQPFTFATLSDLIPEKK